MVGKRLKWQAFGLTSLFFLFEFVSRVEPSLATDQIATHFGISNAGFGTLSSLFFWVYAPMQIVVGLSLDRFGLRRLVVPAILLCALGPIVFAATANPLVAGAGRLMTGLGASFGFVGALYVVNHWFAPNKFAVLSGAVNAIGMLGTAIGAVYLTTLMETVGWQQVFFYTGAAGIVLFVFAVFLLHDRPKAHTDSSATEGAKTFEKTNFIKPLKDILGDGRIWLLSLIGALAYVPVNVFGGLWGHEELIKDHGLSAIQAEVSVSMVFWGTALGSLVVAALSDALGHRKWLVVIGALLAALAYSAAIYSRIDSSLILSLLLFLGGFFGGAQMLVFAMAKEAQSAANVGTVISFVNMIGIGGALIFQPVVGLLVDRDGGNFGIALLIIPGCLGLAALLMMLVKAPTAHQTTEIPV